MCKYIDYAVIALLPQNRLCCHSLSQTQPIDHNVTGWSARCHNQTLGDLYAYNNTLIGKQEAVSSMQIDSFLVRCENHMYICKCIYVYVYMYRHIVEHG